MKHINPATLYIVFSRGVPVRSKAAHRRCSHPTARWGNAVCGPARHGLPEALNAIYLNAIYIVAGLIEPPARPSFSAGGGRIRAVRVSTG